MRRTNAGAEPPRETALKLFPEPTVHLAAEDVYRGISFPTRSPARASETRPYVVINMVASLDGKASAGGKVGSVGSCIDRTLMRNLRARADAVMIGAGTLRAETLTLAVPEDLAGAREARGLGPQPLGVVVTATGNVPLQTNLLGSSPDNLLILVSPEISEERLAFLSSRAAVEIVPEEMAKTPAGCVSSVPGSGAGLDLKKALAILKKRRAVNVLLVEGGPSLNHALISSDLADELFLTLAPKLLGGFRPGALTILEGPPVRSQETELKLISVHLFGDELFLRYAPRAPDRRDLGP